MNKSLACNAMFQACGCSNITPFSRTESQIEFWSRAYDVRANKEILNNLYKTKLLSIDNKSISISFPIITKILGSFRNVIDSNKRSPDGRIRILSIIALKFRTIFMTRLQNSKNLKYRDDLGGLCQICNNYGYETFENLSNMIRSNFEDKTT
ncbi:hypothetical protein Glove_213g189 [Diversispora epigaea]|uniref:Uncharacterized protein n=1 Tax=Diversispora epigaea TaxID=1348612 RepID=A0A397II59_9GLOM|nr:hypothetical protein Glove_213g189 [Diversispora epigaea]